ncbi:MAG: hypothetical protein AAGC60_29475 [Acidobacteriota bacterium]
MTRSKTPVWLSALLWVLAVLMMFSAVVYQRTTGPTYPKRGDLVTADGTLRYKLVRSEYTTTDAAVILPLPAGAAGADATVFFKRYKTEDAWTPLPMAVEASDDGDQLVARLPAQPAAGKLEYYLEVDVDGAGGLAMQRIPQASEDENIIIRFKDPVPTALLAAHVIFMFFSVLIGMRTGLGALFAPNGMRRLAWITFTGLTIGGMILGPFVQKYAFGEYWTGFPWGYDLTDNKMLIMWLAWLIACTSVGLKPKRKEGVGRVVVVIAALVMTVVYLIPHSMRGSELDYSKVDQGIAPSEAIGTGD